MSNRLAKIENLQGRRGSFKCFYRTNIALLHLSSSWIWAWMHAGQLQPWLSRNRRAAQQLKSSLNFSECSAMRGNHLLYMRQPELGRPRASSQLNHNYVLILVINLWYVYEIYEYMRMCGCMYICPVKTLSASRGAAWVNLRPVRSGTTRRQAWRSRNNILTMENMFLWRYENQIWTIEKTWFHFSVETSDSNTSKIKALDKRSNSSGLSITLEQRLRQEHGLQMVGLTCPKWSVQFNRFNLQDLEKVAIRGHLTTRGQGHSTKTQMTRSDMSLIMSLIVSLMIKLRVAWAGVSVGSGWHLQSAEKFSSQCAPWAGT